MFYSALSGWLYRDCGEKKAFFLRLFNLPKYIVVGLLTMEWLCSLLLINMLDRKLLTDVFGG